MNKFVYSFIFCFVISILAVSANALVISDGVNTTPAAFGWNYTVELSTGTGVYLGNGWVMTAYHVYDDRTDHPVTFFDGRICNEVANSGSQIPNTDLALFRISNAPALTPLTIKTDPVSAGDNLLITATGLQQEATTTTWWYNRFDKSWVESDTRPSGSGWNESEGYKTIDHNTRTWTWGTNTVLNPDVVNDMVPTKLFSSDFDKQANEAQFVIYDSGAPVFIQNSFGQYELAGIALLVDGYTGTNAPEIGYSAIYGLNSYFADLSEYNINTLIPEPATILLFGTAGLAVLRKKKS